MPHSNGSLQRYVLGDWGTSRLRLFLVENGENVTSREGPGIGALTAAPAGTLVELLMPWMKAAQPMDVVLSGMVGSRNGLLETPYVLLPVDCTAWSQAAASTQLPGMNITIATGLRDDSHDRASDVMRGEETQIFGALQLDATLRTGSHLFVLPGTHSKWVVVENGSVVRFQTALTGEVYALLRDHSMLLRAGGVNGAPDADADAGFVAGVKRSTHLATGLLGALFEARTAQLLQHRSRAWASGFLSGLLISEEIAGMSATYSMVRGVKIIGNTQLAVLYQRVFADRGVATHALDGTACAVAGLRYLRESVQRGEM